MTHGISQNLILLKTALTQIQEFLPGNSIKYFRSDNVTLNFDPSNPSNPSLNNLYNDLASSFWFRPEVRDLFLRVKGKATLASSSDDLSSMTQNCLQLAELINKIASPILDKNLLVFWKRVRQAHPSFPKFETPAEIRSWIKDNSASLKSITSLDLTRSELTLVPPEILEFQGLQEVYLYETKVSSPPQAQDSHLSWKKTHLDTSPFLEDTLSSDL